MEVLVTGGSGFIGSHLTHRLVDKGYDVTVMDNLQLDYGKVKNLRRVSGDISFVRGDVRDLSEVAKASRNIEIIFHLAAMSHLPLCRTNPLQTVEVNTLGTLNVLEASRLNGVRTVILAGSDHIYGDAEYIPIDEKHPHKPKDSYSLSKVQAMSLCRLYHEEYGLDTRILVSGNVFGEFQDSSKVVPIFISKALKGLPITLFGGNQTRAFYYISNLVDAYMVVAEKAVPGIYNVDGYTEVTLRMLAEDIIAKTGSRSEIQVEPYRYDEHQDFRLLLDKTKIEGLGYREAVGYGEGLGRTIGWYMNEGSR